MWGWLTQLFGRSAQPGEPPEPPPLIVPPRIASGAWNTPLEASPPPALPPKHTRELLPRQDISFICAVVGESFANDDGTSRQAIIDECIVGEAILLEAEPTNRFDPHAVAVRRAADRRQIGHIKRDVAERFLEQCDSGYIYSASIADIRGDPGFAYKGVFLEISLKDARAGHR